MMEKMLSIIQTTPVIVVVQLKALHQQLDKVTQQQQALREEASAKKRKKKKKEKSKSKHKQVGARVWCFAVRQVIAVIVIGVCCRWCKKNIAVAR